MKTNLKNYPFGTSWQERDLWKNSFEKELREILEKEETAMQVDGNVVYLIKQILGEK